jgi:hypothetical protein
LKKLIFHVLTGHKKQAILFFDFILTSFDKTIAAFQFSKNQVTHYIISLILERRKNTYCKAFKKHRTERRPAFF